MMATGSSVSSVPDDDNADEVDFILLGSNTLYAYDSSISSIENQAFLTHLH